MYDLQKASLRYLQKACVRVLTERVRVLTQAFCKILTERVRRLTEGLCKTLYTSLRGRLPVLRFLVIFFDPTDRHTQNQETYSTLNE